MIFKNSKVYDFLLKLLKYGVPAICFVISGFSEMLGWPYGAYVVGGIGILAEGLAIFLGISKNEYKKLTADNYGYDEENDPTEEDAE